MNGRDAAKYFVHGIAFSFLFLILANVWLFYLVFLGGITTGAPISPYEGQFIGLTIELGLHFLIFGVLNAEITSTLWFKVKKGFWNLLLHGVVLFVILIIVNFVIQTLPNLAQPGIPTTVITFLIAAFADGLIAKNVARLWEEKHETHVYKAVESEWQDKQV